MRILFIKYAAIGDVLNATPAIRALRRRYPDAVIDCLVGEWSAPALAGNPDIDEAIVFDEGIFRRREAGAILGLAWRLRRRRYDLSICLHRSFLVNLWVFLAGARRRLGFINGRLSAPLLHGHVLEDEYRETRKHAIEYYNDVVAPAGAVGDRDMVLALPEPSPGAARFLAEAWRPGRIRIGVCAGGARNAHATESRKRWFLESYAEVVAAMPECDFVLFGAPFDAYTADFMRQRGLANALDAVGRFSLRDTAAIMSRCDAFLTHDTGLLHIASALRLPLVSIFGPTSYRRHGPLGENAVILRSDVACSPCYIPARNAFAPCDTLQCLREITPEKVVAALRQVLRTAHAGVSP